MCMLSPGLSGACACNVNPDLDTKAHRIERKCTQYATWIQARQSKGVQVQVVATQFTSLSEQ